MWFESIGGAPTVPATETAATGRGGRGQAPRPDRIVALKAPFTGQPVEIFRWTQAIGGIQLSEKGGLALIESGGGRGGNGGGGGGDAHLLIGREAERDHADRRGFVFGGEDGVEGIDQNQIGLELGGGLTKRDV